MDDFDNDGLLDIFVTSFSPSEPAALFRNLGNGQFEEPTQSTGIKSEYFSINCMQTDFNNDGRIDIYIPRGAWLKHPLRPTLLRNDGNFSFVDVTAEAGLLDPVNSNAAQWADFDNDGWLDLFVCCEQQPNRLFHNQQNGTFKNVATAAGLGGNRSKFTKGCAWIDYDNDNFPDLFLNHFGDTGQLYHNEKNGTFTDVTDAMGIDGPPNGFSCWAWDYDNDGWLDIFATCYQRTLKDVILGLTGRPHELKSSKLYRNLQGRSFKDVTREVGLDLVFGTMGSNYGDFDNDGYLDMYLGTGEPDVATLIPNRLFKNQAGQKFVEITTAAGVGHLQKGHGIACGDWDRDGHVDIFCQTGGVIPGDKYHNLLFQNPGNAGNWLGLKLIGKSTNRAALGARIKIVTNSAHPQSIYRHISSGSSFGANPLEQTIGLGNCDRILELEIQWPTSGTSQKFKDLGVNQTLEIIESSAEFKTLERSRISWHSFASNAGGRESATPKKR